MCYYSLKTAVARETRVLRALGEFPVATDTCIVATETCVSGPYSHV